MKSNRNNLFSHTKKKSDEAVNKAAIISAEEKKRKHIDIKFEVSEPCNAPPNSPKKITANTLFAPKQPDEQINHAIYELEIMQKKQMEKK